MSLDGIFFETASGRTSVPTLSTEGSVTMPDGRVITGNATPEGNHWNVSLTAKPDSDITGWGFSLYSSPDAYYTGLMERVVDGPQQASWAPGITAAMNLRGQRVEMIAKPTTSVYSPFYISSEGYSLFVKGTWPGVFDFAAAQKDRVQVSFEGPSFEMVVYTLCRLAECVSDHAMNAGPPVLPPKWMYGPWRWRDEHTQRTTYYDGTPVTGPFNSEVMEDVLMMQAFGIPNGVVYWIDRPRGRGQIGYDDFEIDDKRLPHFAEMTRWLDSLQAKTLL